MSENALGSLGIASPWPNLYPFSTLWAIAFWGLFNYTAFEEESLLGTTHDPEMRCSNSRYGVL
jgi:hypothetical protein